MAEEAGRGNAQESQAAIGAGEITLTGNLNDTRHIDIVIKRSNGPQPQASGVVAAPEDTAALNGRLKITVAVEKDADKEKGDEEKLMAMRGWLMTVGTLFVTMAFQAALQPPEWMRTVDFLRIDRSAIDQFKHPFRGASHAAATAPAMQFAPSPGPSPQAAESTAGLYWRALAYTTCNVFTLASALSLVLLLLRDLPRARAKRTMNAAAWMMVVIGSCVVGTFALGSSGQWLYTLVVAFAVVVYASLVLHCVNPGYCGEAFAMIRGRRTGERPANAP